MTHKTRFFSFLSLTVSIGLSHAATETVDTETLNLSSIPELDCVIEPSEVVDISPVVSGLIKSIHFERGDLVKKSSLLLELDSTVEQASLNLSSAKAEMDSAIELRQASLLLGYKTENRNQELFKKSAISEQEFDQINTDIKIAELKLKHEQDNKYIARMEHKRALAKLQQRSIKSPIDGVVLERFRSVGELVDNDPVMRIAKLDPLHVEVIMPIDYLGAIKPGMTANVTPTIGNNKPYMATVELIDRVVDTASGTFGVRLSLTNPDYLISAGLRCVLEFLPDHSIPSIAVTEVKVVN